MLSSTVARTGNAHRAARAAGATEATPAARAQKTGEPEGPPWLVAMDMLEQQLEVIERGLSPILHELGLS